MEEYKDLTNDAFSESKYNTFEINQQYEEISNSIFYSDHKSNVEDLNIEFKIFQLNNILSSQKLIDDDEISELVSDIDEYLSVFNPCPQFYSTEFIIIIETMLSNPSYDIYSINLLHIIRNLWEKTKDQNIIFSKEIIRTIFSYLPRAGNAESCYIFNLFYILLNKYPDSLSFLMELDLINSIFQFYSVLDERNCSNILILPLYLIYYLIDFISDQNVLFQFFNICFRYISSQYFTARPISTQCVYKMLYKNQDLISTFFNEESVSTVIRSHCLISQYQYKPLFELDALLIKTRQHRFLDGFVNDSKKTFIRTISTNIFGESEFKYRVRENIVYVLRFLFETMEHFWLPLYNPSFYGFPEQLPIIFKILKISTDNSFQERKAAGLCIANFIRFADNEAKYNVGKKGGFASLCDLVQNVNPKFQFPILQVLKELLEFKGEADSFQNEAFDFDLANLLSQIENNDENVVCIINDILKYL